MLTEWYNRKKLKRWKFKGFWTAIWFALYNDFTFPPSQRRFLRSSVHIRAKNLQKLANWREGRRVVENKGGAETLRQLTECGPPLATMHQKRIASARQNPNPYFSQFPSRENWVAYPRHHRLNGGSGPARRYSGINNY